MRRRAWMNGAALAAALTLAACGGDNGGSTPTTPTPTPTPTPSPSPSPAPSGATITITSSGVSPKSVIVAAGSRVTFVNNDTRPHDMSSNPHPEHTDCPEITVGSIQPGESRSTSNLTNVRTCGYHDHNQDSNTSLQGTITIQ